VGIVVLVAGLAVTTGLTAIAFSLYDHNENRLLELRVRELGLVLATTAQTVQTPLASAAALAQATNGNAGQLRQLLAPEVGPKGQFVSVSVWPLDSAHLAPAAVFGVEPLLVSHPSLAAAFFARVRRSHALSVTGLMRSGRQLRLGYGFATPTVRHAYAVYAETVLPANRRSRLSSNSAFADLNYVLYLGRRQDPAQLLVTNLAHTPATGRRASDVVTFGDSHLALVVTPRGSLGGGFFERLPWIIAAVGVLLTLAAALLTDRLVRRRQRAEDLAGRLDRVAEENRMLYAEQRTIADTLQHALLPQALPAIRGLESGTRYVPGATGVEIGGDWYDLVAQDDGRALVVVGDVAGRGVPAATAMAALRFAVLAYAADGAGPAELLAKLSRFAVGHPGAYFATVLCARLDLAQGLVTVASAGHLPPLLIAAAGTDYLPLEVGVPIGVDGPAADYADVATPMPEDGTLLAFTDGLVERRGEVLDAGLARLRAIAGREGPSAPLEDLLSRLVDELPTPGSHEDDTAILAVRWQAIPTP